MISYNKKADDPIDTYGESQNLHMGLVFQRFFFSFFAFSFQEYGAFLDPPCHAMSLFDWPPLLPQWWHYLCTIGDIN